MLLLQRSHAQPRGVRPAACSSASTMSIAALRIDSDMPKEYGNLCSEKPRYLRDRVGSSREGCQGPREMVDLPANNLEQVVGAVCSESVLLDREEEVLELSGWH